MRILYVHSLMFNRLTWAGVAKRLAKEELELILVDQMNPEEVLKELASGRVDLFIAGVVGARKDLKRSWNRAGPRAIEFP